MEVTFTSELTSVATMKVRKTWLPLATFTIRGHSQTTKTVTGWGKCQRKSAWGEGRVHEKSAIMKKYPDYHQFLMQH